MQQPTTTRSHLLPRLVAGAFMSSIIVLGVASWDVARGRVPDTNAALLLDVLNSPENRTCTRDLPELAARHFPVGMGEAEAKALLAASTVTPPVPLFWTPKVEDAVSGTNPAGEIVFVRTLRFTPFGNHHVNGTIKLADGKVTASRLRVVCALG